ncbi:MAG: Cu(I)-responsive transcriptional regulator [Methyloligellaceae bacterium]
MNIGEAATEAGLPAKTLRYYEDIGLVTPQRSDNGYRHYAEEDIHKLRFLQRSRSLGFTIADCRTLISLYEDTSRASADVKSIAKSHLDQVEIKIQELESLRNTLKHLINSCKGDHRPDCPILDDLSRKSKS